MIFATFEYYINYWIIQFIFFFFIILSSQHEYVFAFKQARRREDDIAIVNTGMKALLEKETNSGLWKIKDCSFSFGGMAPTTVMAMKTIKGLTGRYAALETDR